MGILSNLNPQPVFYFFEEICNIPHGSGNEKALSEYIVAFAKKKNLYYRIDSSNNVLIKKPAYFGHEKSPTLIIQGHIDMVCEKNAVTMHDFLTEPLNLFIDEDFIKAKGTTLGADNGIAVAYMLAILSSDDITHPPIEAVFTVDEEVGMKGAYTFDTFDITGKYFLNMDTEEEGTLLVSCCGGQRASLSLPITREPKPTFGTPHRLYISGLKGGHSGADIHLQRANANKLMGRILLEISHAYEYRLARINGGLMDNAISRECEAILLLNENDVLEIKACIEKLEKTFLHEYRNSDTSISINLEPLNEDISQVLTEETRKKIIAVLTLIPYGVTTNSLDMPGLVESSSNLGIVKTESDAVTFHSALRSSIESRKEVIYNQICQIGELVGANITSSAKYPSWEYNKDSKLLKLFQQAYEDLYGEPAKISSIHAGIECGIFGKKIENLDMISIGPNMFDVHTPDERLSISSTARVWEFLRKIWEII